MNLVAVSVVAAMKMTLKKINFLIEVCEFLK